MTKMKAVGAAITGTLCAGLTLVAPTFASAQINMPIQKKLIAAGWDRPNAQTFRQNIKIMEKTPYNGVIINIEGRNDSGKYVTASRNNFSDQPLKKEWFQSSIDDLKATHSEQFTDNFIQTSANPGDVDWFDDAGWKTIVKNYRIIAEIADEGGLKGIQFDPEPYTKPYRQFTYAMQGQRDKHSFAEYQEKVRQRGKELMGAIASVNPNFVIFTYLMNSVNAAAAQSAYPEATLQYAQYGLYPAFINGWLDAAPPTMTFVDGAELQGYKANDEFTFLKTADIMRGSALNLVAPENRRKYAAQVQSSFGIYLDAYLNPPTSRWYIDPKGSTPTERLKTNIEYAADASTEYVWTWGEKYRWWPVTGEKAEKQVNPQSWEEMLPGIGAALNSVFLPPKQTLQQKITALLADKNRVNLVKNGDFASTAKSVSRKGAPTDWDANGAPANWSTWQQKNSSGTFTLDNNVRHGNSGNSLRINNVHNGSLIQAIDAEPGATFLIQGWLRQLGAGTTFVWVRWQHEGKFVDSSSSDALIPVAPNTRAGDWGQFQGVATAPAGASRLVILVTVMRQDSAEDAVWASNFEAYKIP